MRTVTVAVLIQVWMAKPCIQTGSNWLRVEDVYGEFARGKGKE